MTNLSKAYEHRERMKDPAYSAAYHKLEAEYLRLLQICELLVRAKVAGNCNQDNPDLIHDLLRWVTREESQLELDQLEAQCKEKFDEASRRLRDFSGTC